MPTHTITGHYVTDDGLYEPGVLVAEATADGLVSADDGGRLHATEFAAATGIVYIVIASTHGAWRFVPSAGACERIGLPVTRL